MNIVQFIFFICYSRLIFNFQTDNEIQKKLQSITFLGPFERYKLVKPYVQEQEEKAEAERAKQEEERTNKTSINGELIEERTNEQRIEAVSNILFLPTLFLFLVTFVSLMLLPSLSCSSPLFHAPPLSLARSLSAYLLTNH